MEITSLSTIDSISALFTFFLSCIFLLVLPIRLSVSVSFSVRHTHIHTHVHKFSHTPAAVKTLSLKIGVGDSACWGQGDFPLHCKLKIDWPVTLSLIKSAHLSSPVTLHKYTQGQKYTHIGRPLLLEN
uniref:Uncharacterized protein n=1 Tax=Lates calcarifer TaxID=8187 RepID=A0A4W6C2Q4_LATCA